MTILPFALSCTKPYPPDRDREPPDRDRPQQTPVAAARRFRRRHPSLRLPAQPPSSASGAGRGRPRFRPPRARARSAPAAAGRPPPARASSAPAAVGSSAPDATRTVHLANTTRDLKKRVLWVLGVEVDPDGGPQVQDAAMRLYHSRRRGKGEETGKVELLQAFHAMEAAVRRFFFAYRQLVAAVMGTAEASGNRALFMPAEGMDPLAQMFLEPPYYASLDAAKTFLADY